MTNKWGFSKEVEDFVKNRDLSCIYCGNEFANTGKLEKSSPSWEHIINDIMIKGIDNIALCCRSCNASKGSKTLKDWLESSYCKNKGIDKYNIALVARKHLES